jgi:hypothetical protein
MHAKGWNTLSFEASDENYNSLANVSVNITDNLGNKYNGVTDANGLLSLTVLNWDLDLRGIIAGYELREITDYNMSNNYTITYSKNGYITQQKRFINLAEDKTDYITLNSWIINGSLVIMPGSKITII